MKKYLRLITSILVCQLAGVIGSFSTFSSVNTWYKTLNKPCFTPPSWVFGPAWLTLYTLMGIAAFLIWEKRKENNVKGALTIFGIQLVANTLWSIFFFGMRSPLLGLIDIIILWILIFLTTIKFMKISKQAGLLLVPYLLWVTFATALNIGILLLN